MSGVKDASRKIYRIKNSSKISKTKRNASCNKAEVQKANKIDYWLFQSIDTIDPCYRSVSIGQNARTYTHTHLRKKNIRMENKIKTNQTQN